jgi:hypothetical protein
VAGAEECYPIWKQRLDTNTLVTTPNSDLVYTMSTWTGARTVGSCSGAPQGTDAAACVGV